MLFDGVVLTVVSLVGVCFVVWNIDTWVSSHLLKGVLISRFVIFILTFQHNTYI
jgi:hypothetical protein